MGRVAQLVENEATLSDVTRVNDGRRRPFVGRSRPAYVAELDALPAAYASSVAPATADLMAAGLAAMGSCQAVYVGSGGTIAVARLAAELHLARTGSLALATTPLGVVGLDYPRDAAAMVISSRAAHPDVALGIEGSRRALLDPVLLLTHRDPGDLGPVARLPSAIVRLPFDGPREGFLATRSVLAFAAAITAGSGHQLPANLPAFAAPPPVASITERILILHGSRGSAPAADLETRLSELGLTAVATADYRNFAHGRHVGFARHLESTLVVAFIDAADVPIANATIALLPDATQLVRIESQLQWPAAALDLLVGSMRLVGELAKRDEADPARPTVPVFGRRLYHLPARRRLLTRVPGAVDRKLAVVGRTGSDALHSAYRTALEGWLRDLQEVPIVGVVVDYDGTVCATSDRFALPRDDIQAALLALLRAGLVLGVASGRGRSLVRDLRAWVPIDLWDRVEVGLYNGGVTGALGTKLEGGPPLPTITAIEARIAEHPLTASLRARARGGQLTLEVSDFDAAVVAGAILDVAARPPVLDVRLVQSGHSLDVVAAGSKRRVAERLTERTGGAILAIGDQGQPGGNDHDLLAGTPWSLSVDRCSADPTRCWNLLPVGVKGPEGLRRYIEALRPRAGAGAFRWSDAR